MGGYNKGDGDKPCINILQRHWPVGTVPQTSMIGPHYSGTRTVTERRQNDRRTSARHLSGWTLATGQRQPPSRVCWARPPSRTRPRRTVAVTAVAVAAGASATAVRRVRGVGTQDAGAWVLSVANRTPIVWRAD